MQKIKSNWRSECKDMTEEQANELVEALHTFIRCAVRLERAFDRGEGTHSEGYHMDVAERYLRDQLLAIRK